LSFRQFFFGHLKPYVHEIEEMPTTHHIHAGRSVTSLDASQKIGRIDLCDESPGKHLAQPQRVCMGASPRKPTKKKPYVKELRKVVRRARLRKKNRARHQETVNSWVFRTFEKKAHFVFHGGQEIT